MPPTKFDLLQMFRGLAAVGVVFHHASASTSAFVSQIPPWLSSVFQQGFLGVDFFFVLSGFIIMKSHFSDNKSISALKNYGLKRFVRVFPPYWPVSIVLMLGYFAHPSLSQGTRADFSLLSSVLLLPAASAPALSVAWTLIHEVIFYLIFSLFFISNRLFLACVALWALAMCTAAWGGGESDSPTLVFLLKPINFEFLLGLGVAWCARTTPHRFAKPLCLVGGALFVSLLCWPFALDFRVLFGVPFSLLVLGAVLLERQGKVVLPRWMIMLGDASYSIYLVHNPTISITSRLIGKFSILRRWGFGMLTGIVVSIIAGILYHLLIEKPLIRLFRRYIERLRAVAP